MSETTKDKPTTTVNARLRRDRTNTMRHRLRKQARPHYLLAGLVAAGATAGQLAAATDPATVAGGVLATGVAATGTAWLARRGKTSRVSSARQLAGGLAATCWCGWVATAGGLDWTSIAVLAAVGTPRPWAGGAGTGCPTHPRSPRRWWPRTTRTTRRCCGPNTSAASPAMPCRAAR